MDKIIIKGLRVYAFHGVKAAEKEKGQPFELDISIYSDLKTPGRSDSLSDTINYSKAAQLAESVIKSGKDDLIERAAWRVAEAILHQFPANSVTVMLKKPRAPVAADFEYMAVEITLCRDDLR